MNLLKHSMIIGVDGNEANVEKHVGVSVYTLNLLQYFKKNATEDLQFRVFLKEKPGLILPKENRFFRYIVISPKILWSQLFLPLTLFFKKDINVFFSPAHYAPRFCPVPIVVTVHDLSYFYYPNEFLKKDLYQLKNWTKYSVEKAKKVITVSNNTKKDLLKFYSVPEEKVEMIYNGFGRLNDVKVVKSCFETNKPYLLYVGTLQPRKNVLVLIKAFRKFSGKHPEYKLLLVGKKGWLYDEIFQTVKDFKLSKKIIFTDYVSDGELASLYQNAFCLVFPSLYEGFGIPLLEAMSLSCPVISSNSSSLPEVGGEACLYFDPINENELVEKLVFLHNNAGVREELVERGKERVKQFSWQKSSQQTLEVLKSAI